MLTWELLGSLLGAGFASGREIAAFFARYGAPGYAGAVMAAFFLVWLAGTEWPPDWQNKWPERIWKTMLAALLAATGGAMLSGAGEVAALTLPLQHADWWGRGITIAAAWLLACKTKAGLAWISRLMILVFAWVLLIGLTAARTAAFPLQHGSLAEALVRGCCYGGFNAALLIPVLHRSESSSLSRERSLRYAGILMLILLFGGIAALQRQPALIHEPLPFVQMLNGRGKFGFYLSAACLYLAILSTLIACIRGLNHSAVGMLSIIGISFLGFGRVVDVAYTLLGGGCMLMLLAAKFRNCARKAFISGKDML